MKLTVITSPDRGALESEMLRLMKINTELSVNGVTVIVPDQSSFIEEEKLIAAFGVSGLGNPETLSFKRLFYKLSAAFPSGKTRLTAPAREMAVMHALGGIEKDDLRLFRGVVKRRELTSTVSALITGFKRYGVTAEKLRAAEDGLAENSPLRNKVHDCRLALEGYDGFIAGSGLCDADDDLSELSRILALPECKFFNGKTVCVKYFSDLNLLQRNCVGQICRSADRVFVAVCWEDRPEFSTAKKLIDALERTAADFGADFARIDLPVRKRADAVGFLSSSLYDPSAAAYGGEIRGQLRLHVSRNPLSEVRRVAAAIARLTKQGRRCRDIAVIARDPESYAGYVRRIFPIYSIPVFVDEKRPLSQHSVSSYILSAMELALFGFTHENVFSFAKNPFAPHGGRCGQLEDYCVEAGVRSWNWSEDFTFIRGAYSAKSYASSSPSEELSGINARRRELWELIEPLRLCLSEPRSGIDFARGLYSFMRQSNLASAAESAAMRQEKGGDARGAAETRQVYNFLIDILDDICTVFGESELAPDEFYDAVKTACAAVRIGVVPPTADSVTFGGIERMKGICKPIVFLLGLNEDVFPRAFSRSSIFTEYEAEELRNGWAVELPPDCAEKAENEKLLLYEALSSADETLFLSYSLAAADGRNMRPSSAVKRVRQLFPMLRETEDVSSPDSEYLCATKEAALLELGTAMSEGNDGKFWQLMLSLLKADPDYAPKISKLLRDLRYDPADTEELDGALLKKAIGGELSLSPSALETFGGCPFAYFAQNILRLRDCEPMNINPADSGNLLHNIIDGFCGYVLREKKGNWAAVGDSCADEIFERVCAEVRTGISRQIESDPRLKIAVTRIERMAKKCIDEIRAQLADELFVPTGAEVIIDEDGGIAPSKITLPDGSVARFRGRIDRADVRKGFLTEENGQIKAVDLVRIIDYKSSGRELSFTNVLNGLQLQLFAYMDSFLDSEPNARPAAVLYFNLTEVPVETPIGDENPERKDRLTGAAVVGRMAEHKGIAEIEADEMNTVLSYVRKRMKSAAKKIYGGEMPVSPVVADGRSKCEFCPYGGVCKRSLNGGGHIREISKGDAHEAIKLMKKELEAEGDEI